MPRQQIKHLANQQTEQPTEQQSKSEKHREFARLLRACLTHEECPHHLKGIKQALSDISTATREDYYTEIMIFAILENHDPDYFDREEEAEGAS